VQVQEAVKYLHKKDFELLNGKGFVFNGLNNESYIVEYQKNEFCPSHYTFENYKKLDEDFSSVKLKDVVEFGQNHFKNNVFEIEFNNEVVYELTDEKETATNFFSNMNLMTLKDIKNDTTLYKINSFHKLESDSELTEKLKTKKLIDLKIPYNDILTLSKENKEIHLEFINEKVFS
jgi:hypothetical protein